MSAKKFVSVVFSILVALALTQTGIGPAQAQTAPAAEALDASPPAQTVKIIFIHHSVGENWLTDGYGNLGIALDNNNYFVSDTNYGWGPRTIGDRTDIPNWPEWFRSYYTPTYMNALFAESGQHSSYTRTLTNPGGQNTIVMFKSCFPNSNLDGNPNDPPDPTPGFTVGHAKYVYNEILKYFRNHPDKLFVVITAPPVTDPTYAANARAFNNWLYGTWLTENNYPFSNVAVFDFYNVLTAPGAHHRYNATTGNIEHIVTASNTSYYPSGDDHPNVAGSLKAKNEFVPLLNVFYHRWKADDVPQTLVAYSNGAQDGWILESAENSGAGGTFDNAATVFNLGDDGADKQYRAILSFNTSALPDNAVITRVTLKIKFQGLTGANPFGTHGSLMFDMRKGLFNGNAALEAGDFQAAASKDDAGNIPNTPVNGWYVRTFTNTLFSYISKTGVTQFRLRFATDDNDDLGADFLKFYSGNYGTASARPTLVIEYYVP